jgi:hypothetical protein
MQMLMVAADACWGVEGGPARKLLLPNQQLKLILEQCLAVISVQCGSGLPLAAKVGASVPVVPVSGAFQPASFCYSILP